jgi:hypothetical protein
MASIHITDAKKAAEYYQKYREKKENISLGIKLYLMLRLSTIDPIMLVNDRLTVHNILADMKRGEIKIRSTIENAILDDLKTEFLMGTASTYNYDREVSFGRMMPRYLRLLQQMIITNWDKISYVSMIITAMVNPGLLTLVYPFAVFGYALFEETRPTKGFWYKIMFYTQTLMIVEFVFSLSIWDTTDQDSFIQ